MAEPVKLFFAYAREDQKLRAELAKHLAPLRRSRLLSDWHDGDITAGSEWAADIDQALHAADIILLLISPDFLASDYCYDNEMTKAVARHDAGQAVVIPIILRPCYWEDAPFGKLQALPKDAKPVSHWPHPDDAFFEITKVVRQTAEQVKAKRQAEAEARAEADRRTQAEAERRAAEKAETERMARAETLLPPPFAWVKIPAGQVTLVTEENWADNYIPKGQSRVFKVEPFFMAKYPLTNAQFKPFLEAGGYRDKQWWTEAGWEAREQGWAWDSKAKDWKPTGTPWTEPHYWADKKWNGAEQPVVGISWYEAVAYCRWLSGQTGQKIMLPTEQQWQFAAQGQAGRVYPWGNDWDCHRCNNSVKPCDSNVTTPVRQYEGKGDSPFGVVDIAGNVWEWCLTQYHSGSNDLEGTDVRVLRGGSWINYSADHLRAASRLRDDPRNGSNNGGMRLALSL